MNNLRNLHDILGDELRSRGAVSFARFMELALYCPEFGYYESLEAIPGRSGDFFTSVSVGPLFGQLLAFQFSQWLPHVAAGVPPAVEPGVPPGGFGPPSPSVLEPPFGSRFQLVESGAHDARLALDILTWFRACQPSLLESLEYWIIEPSPRREALQRFTLAEFARSVRWFKNWDTLPASGVHGIIFSNELLDAFPVHRLAWDATSHQWFEWGVSLACVPGTPTGRPAPCLPESFISQDSSVTSGAAVVTPSPGGEGRGEGERSTGGLGKPLGRGEGEPPIGAGLGKPSGQLSTSPQLTWTKLPIPPSLLAASGLSQLPSELLQTLPDNFTTEFCPAAAEWWRQAASVLRSGKLLTIDYGLTADEFFLPQRAQGTLRAYRHHQVSSDLLAYPGEQDLTAHVNFTTLQRAGESTGLRTEAFQTQSQFLTSILARAQQTPDALGQWTPKHTRQFQTLTHPEHLGRPFRILVQGR